MNNQDKTKDKLNIELQELQHAFNLLNTAFDNESLRHIQALAAFNESERRFRNLYEFSPVNYFTLDANASIIDVNISWLQTLGYSREEVIGHNFSEFITPESARLMKTSFPDFYDAEVIHDFEIEMVRKSGTSLIVQFEARKNVDEKGNFLNTLCIFTDVSKRRKDEESLRIKDWALESAIDAFAISDLHGYITYVNPAFYKLWGYSNPDEIIGKPAIGFWQTGEKAEEVIEALQQNGGWSGELVARNKAGKGVDIQVSASMVKDVAGRPVCMLASFADISNSKTDERLKAENEISYRELFNNVADAIYIMDDEGTFLDVNDGAVKMYGYPRELLVGKNPSFVSAPGKNDLDNLAVMLERAYAGESQQFEFWGQRSNGEIFPKEVRVINGNYFGKKVNIAIAQDITERKEAQIALQESERQYRELIELAVDGILIGSPEGIIVGANTYMQKLTGRSLKDLIGINVGELFSENALKNAPLRYDLLQKGETVFSERDLLRPDGQVIAIEMHTKMMPGGTYQSIYRDVTERNKAEETLRQSELKFKSLVESTSDMIWETNNDGKYTYVSPQFENLLGYPPEEVIGTSPFSYIESKDISEIISQSDSIVQKAISFSSLVNQYKHRDGHVLYFETSGVPVFNNSGKHIGYRGVSRDITKRHLAEKELHKLSSVVHQSPNTIIITNLEGNMEYINPAGCTISGYSVEELIGENPSIFSSGRTSKATYSSLWSTIKRGKEWKGVFENRKKNGDFFWESAYIVPLRDSEGTVTHFLGVKEDITKRIQAEAALKESEERYRELFEASPDAIILADIETGMLIDANTAACNLLGRSLNEIRQMHQTMIHPERYKGFSAESFDEHIQKSRSLVKLQPIESFVLRPDGTEIPVEVLSNTNVFQGRQVLQGVFRNITERNQAREELMKAKEKAEASDKLKSAFLNNISHELRTPLNGIIGFSEMITQIDSTEEDRLEFSKMIKKSSTRLINTITSYMDISMIVSGITEINRHSFSINRFLDKITDQSIEMCNSRNLKLNIIKKSQTDDYQIDTDEDLLTKIFFQLIDNAIKFTPEGSVTIGHEFKNGFHQFSVSDTGMGISGDSLSVIFEVFMQADLSTSRGYDGSGLGLSIAQGFVKLLGGKIWVESNKDEGSTFFFTIPEKNSAKATKIENADNSDLLQSTSTVILVAEDDDSNYKYLDIILRKASYTVVRATNGFESVEICRSNPEIRVLLTDLKMPGMDGFESTRQIRKFLPGLPIIVLSAFVTSSGEDAAKAAGCTEYLEKPVNKDKLLAAIGKILKSN